MALTPAGGVPISNESLEGGYILAEVGGNTRRVSSGDFTSIANMAASTKLFDGQTVYANGEAFTYDAASTATADGALIVTATGMGVGRLISTRKIYADYAELDADARIDADGVTLSIPNVMTYEAVSTGENLTTTAGKKLLAKTSTNGFNALGFGADKGLSVANDAELLAALEASKNGVLDLGTSEYGWGGDSIILNGMPGWNSLHIKGNGALIKEIADSTASRFSRILQFLPTGVGEDIDSLTIEGITIDHNGSGITTPPAIAYDWEQAHCIAIAPSASNTINKVLIRDVNTRDLIGGGIVFAAGHIVEAVVDNCHGDPAFPYGQGKRGDLEFQASIERLSVYSCTGTFVQSEPNTPLPVGASNVKATFYNSAYDIWDLIGYADDTTAQTYELFGCTNGDAGSFWVRQGILKTQGGRFGINDSVDWRNVTGECNGTEWVVRLNDGANTFSSLSITQVSLVKVDIEFVGGKFTADAAADAATTGYAVRATAAVTIAEDPNYRVRFKGVSFDPAFQGTAYFYRAGRYEFKDCALVSRVGAGAIACGGSASQVSHAVIDGCDLSGVSGDLLDVVAVGAAPWSITFRGDMDYGKFGLRGRPATEYQDTNVIHEATWWSDVRPDNDGLTGMTVKLRNKVVGEACEWVCTFGHVSNLAIFTMTEQAGIAKDTTANRPVPHANDVGLKYLDTTIDADGALIIWNGAGWFDTTGVAV